MKRTVLSFFTVFCMISTSLQGTDLSESDEPSKTEAVEVLGTEGEEITGTDVTPSSDKAQKAKVRQMWQNIGIAIGAVVVAVTALILVSNHHGKKATH